MDAVEALLLARAQFGLKLARFDFAQVEQLVDQRQQPLAVLKNECCVLLYGCRILVLEQLLCGIDYKGKRCLEFVGEVYKKTRLCGIQLLEFLGLLAHLCRSLQHLSFQLFSLPGN